MTDSCKNDIEKSMEPRLLWRSSYYQYQIASIRKSYSFRSNLQGPGLRLHQVPIKRIGSTASWLRILGNVVLLLQWSSHLWMACNRLGDPCHAIPLPLNGISAGCDHRSLPRLVLYLCPIKLIDGHPTPFSI